MLKYNIYLNIYLKALLHNVVLEPELYGDLVFKFRCIVGNTGFSEQWKEIVTLNEIIVYNNKNNKKKNIMLHVWLLSK